MPPLPRARRAALRTSLALLPLALLLALTACRGPREAAEPAPASAEARVAAVRARTADLDAFDFGVGVRSLARGPIIGRLAAGDAVADGLPYDAFITELRAGAPLTADLRTEDFGPVLTVLAPSGETLFGETPGDAPDRAQLSMVAPTAGRYLLLVMPAAGTTGGVYQLEVETPGPVVAYPPELLR